MDREDDKDAEGMEALEGGLCWVSGGYEGRKPYEAATSGLNFCKRSCNVVVEHRLARAKYGARECDYWRS